MEAERLEAERQAKLEKQWDDADRAQFGRDVASVAATEPGRRLLAWTGGRRGALLSWSGTMFEYMMGALLLPAWPDTLSAAARRGLN